MFRILELDGGGIKGVIEAKVCEKIEQQSGKKICEIFHLITGTSTGAILGGCLAAGVPASELVKFYLEDGPRLFKPRAPLPWNWFRAKYDRAPFIDKLYQVLGYVKMKQVECELMITTFGLSAGRTHFIKSTDPHDWEHNLVEVISWSALSAAAYFGAIDVPGYEWTDRDPGGKYYYRTGESFCDGGQGSQNCTVGYCLMELMARGITDAGILSIGTSAPHAYTPFDRTKKDGYIKEIIDYLGNQAREESPETQVGAGLYVSSKRPEIKFCRLNETIPKEKDRLDNIRDIRLFEGIGARLAQNIPAWVFE